MLSFDVGTPICKINGGDGDGEIIFLDDKVVDHNKMRKITVLNGKLQQLPSKNTRVLYIAGPSGSGKSTYVAEYVKLYVKLYPDAKIILFSRINEEENVSDENPFDGLEFKKIKIDDTLVENPLEIEEAEPNSLFVFDDIDTISNKKILKSLQNFISQCLELGRHKNLKCLITSHLINGNDKKYTRTIMNEMHSLTVFPHSGSAKAIRYCLTEYFGFDKKLSEKIITTNSRWVTIFKTYPQIIMTENIISFADKF
jgi:hypothetical protein